MYALYTRGLFGRGTYSSALRRAGLSQADLRRAAEELRDYVVYWTYAAISDSGLLKEIEGNFRRRIRRSVRDPELMDSILDLLTDAGVLRSYHEILSFEAEPERISPTVPWLARALTLVEERFDSLAEVVRAGKRFPLDPAHVLAMYDNPLTALEVGLAVEGFRLEGRVDSLLLPWSGLGEYVWSLRSALPGVRMMAAAPPGLERLVRLALRTRGVYEGSSLRLFSAEPDRAGLECIRAQEVGESPAAALLLDAVQWANAPLTTVRSAVAGVRSGGRVFILQTLRSRESLPMVILGKLLGANLPPSWEELERALERARLRWRSVSRTGSAAAIEVATGVR